MTTEQHQLLTSRVSKSRLSKQQEVDDELIDNHDHVDTTLNDDESSRVITAASLNEKRSIIPETRVESFDTVVVVDPNQSPVLKSKILVRSHAMCGDDDTKLKACAIAAKQSSSKTGSANSSLSKDSSTDFYTDSTGINLEEFIFATLHKNAKDRQMLLQLEADLRQFLQDPSKQAQRFPQMSSYNRMLVHRISAFFGLDHNVDQTGTSVIVTKTVQSRLPDVEFSKYINSNKFTDDQRRGLRRDVRSCEESGTTYGTDFLTVCDDENLTEYRKTKSFEASDPELERNRSYVMRTRFLTQDSSSTDGGMIESPAGSFSSENYVDGGTSGLVARPWSSTDSYTSSVDGPSRIPLPFHHHHPINGPVATTTTHSVMQKAGSFGGVPAVYRQHFGNMADQHSSPRRSNTDSNKSDNVLRHHAFIEESAAMSPRDGSPNTMMTQYHHHPYMLTTMDTQSAPLPGAIYINPQTGRTIAQTQGAPANNMYRCPIYATTNGSSMSTSSSSPLPYNQFVQVDGINPQMAALSLTQLSTNSTGLIQNCTAAVAAPMLHLDSSQNMAGHHQQPIYYAAYHHPQHHQSTVPLSNDPQSTPTPIALYHPPYAVSNQTGAGTGSPMLVPVQYGSGIQYHQVSGCHPPYYYYAAVPPPPLYIPACALDDDVRVSAETVNNGESTTTDGQRRS